MFLHHWFDIWLRLLTEDSSRLWLLAGLLVILGLVELRIRGGPGHHWRGRWRNLSFAVIYFLLGSAAWAAVLAARPVHFRLHEDGGLLRSLSLVGAYVLFNDFLYYWYHRAQHRFSFLWAIHELHHADTELNVSTSVRTHWLEFPVQAALISVPMLLLMGIDRTAAVIFPFVQTGILVFTHWNVRLRLGPLTPVLCGPQLHRIHHSRLPQHRDTNFCQVLPLYDVLFGTYCAPARDEFPPTGAEGLPVDASIVHALALRPLELWRGTPDLSRLSRAERRRQRRKSI